MVEEPARGVPLVRLGVVAEGQTEVELVSWVLADHLRCRGVEPTPIPLLGNVSVQRLANNMARAYREFDVVTSLVDFYGFGGKGSATVDDLEEQVRQQVRLYIRHRLDVRRVIPYVQKHEFEALLFADVQAFAAIDVSPQDVGQLAAISFQFAPEDIDDHPRTAPSKRIVAVVPDYDKVVGGTVVASEVGLPAMRSACPRFDAWLTRLEALDTKFAGSSNTGR